MGDEGRLFSMPCFRKSLQLLGALWAWRLVGRVATHFLSLSVISEAGAALESQRRSAPKHKKETPRVSQRTNKTTKQTSTRVEESSTPQDSCSTLNFSQSLPFSSQ